MLLQENKTTLLTQQANDRTKIEDLEFQIEEHRLGCGDKENDDDHTQPQRNNTSNSNLSGSGVGLISDEQHRQHQNESNELLNSLKLQQSISKNQLDEIKFLKEEIDRFNIELKQLRLAEEVYTKEKSDTKKQLDEIEKQLNVAKEEAEANVLLKGRVFFNGFQMLKRHRKNLVFKRFS